MEHLGFLFFLKKEKRKRKRTVLVPIPIPPVIETQNAVPCPILQIFKKNTHDSDFEIQT
jgi:hypothetical protein